MSDRQETGMKHYAGCRDCGGHKWCDTSEEAEEAAEEHEQYFGHDAYTGEKEKVQ